MSSACLANIGQHYAGVPYTAKAFSCSARELYTTLFHKLWENVILQQPFISALS